MEQRDIIIVGSGCTGSMAALTAAELGQKVTMLDAGVGYGRKNTVPAKSFLELRRSDPQQYKYFLGDELSSEFTDQVGTGAQLTPPRKYLIERVKELIPMDSTQFFPMESLAYGGLGGGWGLGSCVFSEAELKACSLDPEKMNQAYQWVADHIGLSGDEDDASPFTFSHLRGIQPSVEMDANASALYAAYQKKRNKLQRNGFRMGRPALALLTREKDGRKAYEKNELEFYEEAGSAWRPQVTLEPLIKSGKLEYIPNTLVLKFEEQETGVVVTGRDSETGESFSYQTKRLILALGALGTARLVLNSRGIENDHLPLLCNPYFYVPSLQWRMLGRTLGERSFGYAQLSLFHDPNGKQENVSMASVYTYRQLMLWRLLRQSPFDMVTNRHLFRYLLPAMTIFGIHIPESYRNNARIIKRSDRFQVEYPSIDKKQTALHKFTRAIKDLGCFPIKVVDPGMGSSIHYAGTLPISNEEKKFSISTKGRLHGTNYIFVADGSGFTFLPAKGLTLSLMANAHNVTTNLLSKV